MSKLLAKYAEIYFGLEHILDMEADAQEILSQKVVDIAPHASSQNKVNNFGDSDPSLQFPGF